ncbi:hypothetical protein Tco_0942709 [Tanacetum coccineum]
MKSYMTRLKRIKTDCYGKRSFGHLGISYGKKDIIVCLKLKSSVNKIVQDIQLKSFDLDYEKVKKRILLIEYNGYGILENAALSLKLRSENVFGVWAMLFFLVCLPGDQYMACSICFHMCKSLELEQSRTKHTESDTAADTEAVADTVADIEKKR